MKLRKKVDEVKKKSLVAGALGGGISGSGPSVFMLSKNEATALAVKKEMNDVYNSIGLEHHLYVTRVNEEGMRVEW